MKFKIKNLFSTAASVLFGLLAPAVVFAQDVQRGLNDIRTPFGSSLTGRLGQSQDIIQLIGNVIILLLYIAGAVAVIFVIVGGFWYITSGGNEEQAEKGKNTVVNAIIGIVVIILSYVIINAVVGTISRSR